ncbi:Ig-like domain repeat protein [Nocardioides sp. W3-2-3]|nr:Ig-like domain repeat protein [Nocardioides convexus]
MITANYEGDEKFAGGSDSLEQEVAAAHTTTTVSSSPNPSVVGQPVTVTATVSPVSPATGTPAGAVQFEIDGEPGAYVTLAGGTASIESRHARPWHPPGEGPVPQRGPELRHQHVGRREPHRQQGRHQDRRDQTRRRCRPTASR